MPCPVLSTLQIQCWHPHWLQFSSHQVFPAPPQRCPCPSAMTEGPADRALASFSLQGRAQAKTWPKPRHGPDFSYGKGTCTLYLSSLPCPAHTGSACPEPAPCHCGATSHCRHLSSRPVTCPGGRKSHIALNGFPTQALLSLNTPSPQGCHGRTQLWAHTPLSAVFQLLIKLWGGQITPVVSMGMGECVMLSC